MDVLNPRRRNGFPDGLRSSHLLVSPLYDLTRVWLRTWALDMHCLGSNPALMSYMALGRILFCSYMSSPIRCADWTTMINQSKNYLPSAWKGECTGDAPFREQYKSNHIFTHLMHFH